MTFSATDAAFEGFRIMRRAPLAIVYWGLAYLVAMGLFFVAFGGTLAQLMAMSADAQAGGEPSLQQLQAMIPGLLFMGLVTAPVSLILSAVLYAAVVRAVLRPTEKAFGYMRLGVEEFRVMLVTIVLTVVVCVVGVVCFAIVGALAGLAGASGQNWLWLPIVLLGLASFGVIVWLSLRLSLATSITFDQGRISLFESFAMTKGRSLALLGMTIIAFIMSMVLGLAAMIVMLPFTLTTGGLESLATLDGEPTIAVLRAAWPAITAWVVVNAASAALQLAVLYAPFSAAYRDLKGLSVEG